MPFPFWRGTQLSENDGAGRAGRKSGSVTLVVVFVYFIFSAIGLGLFMLARLHRQWSLTGRDSLLLSTAAENGARAAIGEMGMTLAGRSFPLNLTGEEYEILRSAARAGGTEPLEASLGCGLPLTISGRGGAAEWTAGLGFSPERVTEDGSCFTAAYRGTIDSRGWLTGRARTKRTYLEIEMSVMAGHVHLSAFPFLLAGEKGPEQAADLIAGNSLVLAPPEGVRGRLPAAATERSLIPSNAGPLLAEALKIKIFSPADLTIARIRQALGLEPSPDPVPDGVYLIVDDLGLGGVFVQGDVEEMLLAAAEGRQYIQFLLEEGAWRIWFNPNEPRTEFFGPEDRRSFDLRPLPIVLVNGSVASLGGATVDGLGNLTLSTATETPAILAGLPLTIVSSGETVISSHLVQEGVRWTDGIPYLKDTKAQLFLFASGSDFLTGSKTNGRVRIGASGPDDLYLQAAVTARDGFRLDGSGKNIILSGSLQAGGLEAGTNRLSIRPDDRLLSPLSSPASAPRSTEPVLFISGWEALRWTDR